MCIFIYFLLHIYLYMQMGIVIYRTPKPRTLTPVYGKEPLANKKTNISYTSTSRTRETPLNYSTGFAASVLLALSGTMK